MKKRKPAREKRQMTVEHVSGEAQKVDPQTGAAEVSEPETLQKQYAHGAHADEQRTFQPHTHHRENQGGIAEP